MKTLFVCAAVLLGTITLFAQEQKEVQNLPELQEWYSWKGGFTGSYISYLPDFDSAGGGLNAITQGRDGDPVWYNRFPSDTITQFKWKSQGSYAVYTTDFNNDGIQDYFDLKGRIYTGTKKGEKPNPEPIVQIQRGGTIRPLIGDLNADGFNDLLAYNDDNYFDVILGKEDLTQMKAVTVKYPSPSVYVGGYLTEQGKPRIITFESNKGEETFYLYGLTIINENEIPTVQLAQLAKLRKYKTNADERFYSMFLTNFYTDKIRNKFYVISGYETESKTAIIEAVNDKLVEKNIVELSIGTPNILNASIDGDNTNDFICLTQINKQTNEQRFALYSGNEVEQLTPRAVLPKNVCELTGMLSYVGDVNNDGFNDIAMGGENCFRVYLGIDWKTANIVLPYTNNTFTLHENEPNPIGKDRKTVLPITIKSVGNYTLTVYDVRGVKIKELFNGLLNEGEIKLPLDLSGLLSGLYILKMSNGTLSRERAIIIGE